MRMIVALVVIVVSMFGVRVVAASQTSVPSTLYLTVYACSANRGAPSVQMAPAYAANYRAIDITPTNHHGQVYDYTIKPVGQHFWLTVRTGRCVQRFPVTLIAGHTRHMISFPSKSRVALIDAKHWIAGTIPDGFGNVRLLRADTRRMVATGTIDDGCYYFDLVSGSRYLVEFEATPGFIVDVPVDLSQLTEEEAGKQADLTLELVQSQLVDESR